MFSTFKLRFANGKHGVVWVWSQTAGGAQNWTTGANWVGGVAPTPNEYDTIDMSQANIVGAPTLTLGADRKGKTWKFGDATTLSHDWVVNAGNNLSVTGDDPIIDVVNRFVTLNCVMSARRLHKKGVGGLVLANGSNILSEGLVRITAGEVRATAVGALPNGLNIIFDGPFALTTFLQINNTAAAGFTGGQIIVTAGAYGNLFPSTGNSHYYVSAKSGSNTSKLAVTNGNGGSSITIADVSLFTGILMVGSGSSSSPTFVLGNLQDGVGYGNLQFDGNVSVSATFSFINNTAPLIINNRQFELLVGAGSANGPGIGSNNASSSNPVIVNTAFINNKTGAITLTLGGANAGANAFNGLISNGAGTLSLQKAGAGVWELGNIANTYTGITTITAGILIISQIADATVPSCIGANPSAVETQLILAGGELQYTGVGHSTNKLFRISANSTIRANGLGPLVFSNTGQLGTNNSAAKTLTLGGTNTDANTIACAITVVSASISITKVDTGRWVLTSAVNLSIGTVTISDGTLEITNGTVFDLATLSTTGFGILRLTGFFTTLYLGGLTGSVHLDNKIEAPGFAFITSLVLNLGSSKNLTYSGIISNGAAGMTLTKTGLGTQVLSGTNLYTGETIINQGTLSTSADNNLGSGGAQVRCNGNATWSMGGSIVTYNRPLVIDNGFTLTLTSGNAGKTVTGVLSGNGTLFANHSTTFEFTNAANTFTGPITSATADNTGYGLGFASIGDSSEIITLNGGTGTFRWLSASGSTTTLVNRRFRINNSGQVTISALGTTAASNLIIQQDLIIANSGAKTLRLAGTNTGLNTFAGVIADGVGSVVSISKVEAGLWILSATNTYTGTTSISAGTLRFDTANSLGGDGLLISGTGKAYLNYVGTRNITSLTLGGVLQASGSYGATGSGATFINDTYFLGTGTVTVP